MPNNGVAGGDPTALKMLIDGEIQFFTLMGGIIGTVVPVAEAQQMPFAFASAAEAHRAIDGELGRYIGQEMQAKGMYLFPIAGFDNGMRQMAMVNRPIVAPEDLAGMKFRVPPGQIIFDTMKAFGAEPVATPASGLPARWRRWFLPAQENPLAVGGGLQALRAGQVRQHDQSHLVRLQSDGASSDLAAPAGRCPSGLSRATPRARVRPPTRGTAGVQRRASKWCCAPRARLSTRWTSSPFRARLGGVYAAWKEKLGARGWSLLEAEVGRLS